MLAAKRSRSHPRKEQEMKLRAFLRGFINGLALLPLWRWLRSKE